MDQKVIEADVDDIRGYKWDTSLTNIQCSCIKEDIEWDQHMNRLNNRGKNPPITSEASITFLPTGAL